MSGRRFASERQRRGSLGSRLRRVTVDRVRDRRQAPVQSRRSRRSRRRPGCLVNVVDDPGAHGFRFGSAARSVVLGVAGCLEPHGDVGRVESYETTPFHVGDTPVQR